MQINVLLFAAAKEAAQSDQVAIEIPDQASASDVLEALADQVPQLDTILAASRLAIDSCYVGPDAPVSADSEVALIPPVSGG
jgi:molybdopterin converting factor subunit 1